MGDAHARDYRQVRHRWNALPAAYHYGQRQGRQEAVQDTSAPGEPESEKDRPTVRVVRTADDLRRTPRLGLHSQEQKYSARHHQRGYGARFGEHHTHLPRFARYLGGRQGEQPYPAVAVIGWVHTHKKHRPTWD